MESCMKKCSASLPHDIVIRRTNPDTGPLGQPFGSVDTPSLDPNYSLKGEFTQTKYTVAPKPNKHENPLYLKGGDVLGVNIKTLVPDLIA